MPERMGQRHFLFLQGPPGPLFRLLGERLRAEGHQVTRVNLSGGDAYDWPGDAIAYRGNFDGWSAFVDDLLQDRGITDVLLFGDCRPYHVSAHRMAEDRGVAIHVLEEGYIRPHWMTLEPMGVNGNSLLPRDPHWFLAEAAKLPPAAPVTPISASFGRRARDSYWYYHHVFLGKLRFPSYSAHRPGSLLLDGLGWLWKLGLRKFFPNRPSTRLPDLTDGQFFLFPLQLSADYQIRTHSAFPTMASAARYVIESFARHAPRDTHLLLKAHPLDSSFFNWSSFTRNMARGLRLQGRLHFVDGGDLDALSERARGMVCVNSTSATPALGAGTPVCALGDAVYSMPGTTHQGHIDSFWSNPTPPDERVYPAFRRVLLDRCLIHGGLASESAVATLIDSMVNRLLGRG
jgi:capsular polysaccharide export protein